jgi:hypothetical protein
MGDCPVMKAAPGRAALLAVEVGEHRALFGDAVDVRRAVAHDAMVVTAHVEPADVVGHDEKDVGFARFLLLGLGGCHCNLRGSTITNHSEVRGVPRRSLSHASPMMPSPRRA